MKILFVGDSWRGASDRAMREALVRQPDIEVDDVAPDLTVPRYNAWLLRAQNRLVLPLQLRELKKKVLVAARDFQPDVIVVFKGAYFDAGFIRQLRREIAPIVNMFPDPSPHIYGKKLKLAMHEYDLVISRKKFHPALWKSLYGYDNRCVHVSYGYMPSLHVRYEPPTAFDYDVVLIATCRNEYEMMMREVIERLKARDLKFAIAGNGWLGTGLDKAGDVTFAGERSGAAYVEWLRKGKIVIAPVWTQVKANGAAQPGDEMTERTLECAAAYTFFIHRRTDEAKSLYDEATEVPMFDTAAELADKIAFYLDHEEARRAMAAAAHARAVPAYSIDARAREIVTQLKSVIRS